MTKRGPFNLLSACRAILGIIARTVPAPARERWRQEWEAEILHYWQSRLGVDACPTRQAKFKLLWRTTSSINDALRLRAISIRSSLSQPGDRRPRPPQPKGNAMSDFMQDLRYGLRSLAKQPGFAAVAILTVALGIGANTAIFSIVNGVLLQPLNYPNPERIVMLWTARDYPSTLSMTEVLDFRERQNSFEEMGPFLSWDTGANLTGSGDPVYVNIHPVSAGFFKTLGVSPLLGRTFTEEEQRPGQDRFVVLNHDFWTRHFGADPSIVGTTVALNGISWRPNQGVESFVVLGVMPPEFDFYVSPDVWVPLPLDPTRAGARGNRILRLMARLKPDVTRGLARGDVRRITRELIAEHPDAYPERLAGSRVDDIRSLQEGTTRSARPALLILLAAVGLVLLIACANVANLLLARVAIREKEIALRKALGAGTGRILRQLLTESAILAVAGGVAGCFLAHWSLELLLEFMAFPRESEIGLDLPVFIFALGVSLLTGMLFGLAPAFQSARSDARESLKEGNRSSGTPARARLRGLLVIAEVALSLILLIGAGLLLRSLFNLMQVERGFDFESVQTFRIRPPYPEKSDVVIFYQRLLPRLRALPGVRAAGAISFAHGYGSIPNRRLMPEGFPQNFPEYPIPYGLVSAQYWQVTPGYFEAVGIELLQGRVFRDADSGDAPLSAIVDENFAKEAWPDDESVLGNRVAVPNLEGGEHRWYSVVGVVRHTEASVVPQADTLQAYLPAYQTGRRVMHVAIKTTGDPRVLLPQIRREVASVDPVVALYQVRTLEEYVDRMLAGSRSYAYLIGLFACLALTLSVVGLYGVVAFAVGQRSHEIGIRIALGAGAEHVLALVLREGLFLVGIGSIIGLAGAYGLGRFLEGFLYGVTPTDLWTFAGVTFLLGAVALLACLGPALRATRAGPVVALRSP